MGSVRHRDYRVGNNAGTHRQEICTVYNYIYCTCVFVYVLKYMLFSVVNQSFDVVNKGSNFALCNLFTASCVELLQ